MPHPQVGDRVFVLVKPGRRHIGGYGWVVATRDVDSLRWDSPDWSDHMIRQALRVLGKGVSYAVVCGLQSGACARNRWTRESERGTPGLVWCGPDDLQLDQE